MQLSFVKICARRGKCRFAHCTKPLETGSWFACSWQQWKWRCKEESSCQTREKMSSCVVRHAGAIKEGLIGSREGGIAEGNEDQGCAQHKVRADFLFVEVRNNFQSLTRFGSSHNSCAFTQPATANIESYSQFNMKICAAESLFLSQHPQSHELYGARKRCEEKRKNQ